MSISRLPDSVVELSTLQVFAIVKGDDLEAGIYTLELTRPEMRAYFRRMEGRAQGWFPPYDIEPAT